MRCGLHGDRDVLAKVNLLAIVATSSAIDHQKLALPLKSDDRMVPSTPIVVNALMTISGESPHVGGIDFGTRRSDDYQERLCVQRYKELRPQRMALEHLDR